MNLELLLSLKPDLVVASDWTDPDGLDFLRTHGIPVTVVKTPRTWSDVKKRIGDLGSILGAQGRASSLLASLAARERALAAVRDRVTRPLSVLEYNSFGSSMGSGTLWDDLLTLAGVKNASGALAGDRYGYAALPIEMLVTLDPDWLVLPSQGALDAYGKADFLRNLQKDPVFRNLKAVKTGRILYLPEALKTSTSQAALGAAEAIQHAAYPDLF
jgi:iron complex transport system substrate-binding protein